MKKLFIPSLVVFVLSQIVMFYFAVARISGISGGKYLSGYVAHFLALFVTAFLIVFMLKQINFKFPYLAAIIYCTAAAILIEFIQQMIPYRTFSLEDMFFGVFGAVTFVALGKMAQNINEHLKA